MKNASDRNERKWYQMLRIAANINVSASSGSNSFFKQLPFPGGLHEQIDDTNLDLELDKMPKKKKESLLSKL